LPADAPEGGLCPQCLLKIGLGATGAGPEAASPTTRDSPTDQAPEVIGPYKILDKLGEGGMGVVFLAEQTEPVRRKVALKLIKLGMDSQQVIARFESERQALALMNHPNVAKVFDAGVTDRGRSYFVMEYVPGIAITEYCDLRCLSLRDRLELFTQICDAIHHAHQKGIIHRDVKPSNVLVSTEDDKPALKVIDFGVAKATSQRLTERTLYTQQGILIGTPEYMSPEQARTTALDVDTRTDIYSLGMLLYELLVGALPFDPQTLRGAATVEMLRIIREEDPPNPTTKFSSLGDTASEIARRRHADIPSLARQLRGELEWITMRALEKDPGRRYGSASEFSADVRRHLDDEPVLASPPSRTYRLSKFIKKNKAPVVATLALLAVFVIATAISTAMYLRSEASREAAETEALRNELDSQVVRAVLLDDVEAFLERSERALELHREILGPDDPEYALYLVNLAIMLGSLNFLEPEVTDREARFREESFEAIRRTLPSRDPRLIEALDVIAHGEEEGIDPEDCEWAYREALALRRELMPDDPSLINNLTGLSDLQESRSRRLRSRGLGPEADALEEEALDLLRDALQRERRSTKPGAWSLTDIQKKLSTRLDRKANRLLSAGDALTAEPLFREALTHLEQVLPDDSRRVAILQSRLGRSLMALERFPEAESVLLQSCEALEGELDGKSASFQEATTALAELYRSWEKPAAADRYGARLTRPAVVSMRELGPMQFGEPGRPAITGRLGGFSTRLGERSLWVFSTSNAEPFCETGRPQCRGSWSWTDDLDASDGIGAFRNGADASSRLAEALPFTKEEADYNRVHAEEDCLEARGSTYALIPGAVALDRTRDRALVLYRRGIDLEPPWGFPGQGKSVAVWTDPARRPQRPPTAAGGADLFSAEEPAWNSGAIAAGDHLYAYACDWFRECKVARVPLASVLDREAWRFYTGEGEWDRDWRKARPVIDRAQQLTVHWNAHLGQYLMVHAVASARTIALRAANRPEGPWSEPWIYIVGEPPEQNASSDQLQSALGHPEFARDGGRIEYITYHRATPGFFTGETRLVEITFR
jgi:serine/threonine protein kinase